VEQSTWTPAELSAFLESVQDHRLFASFVLSATTGMRRGEVLGLRWKDVDLDAGRLSVVHTLTTVGGVPVEGGTKTNKSRRRVGLDAVTVDVLRSHRRRQREERLAAGPLWQDTGFVFTQEDGSAIHPDRYSRRFTALVRKAGVPVIRLHDVRHTNATIALEAGVHPKVVSERLGHATVGITLDLYSHVSPSIDQAAAETIAGMVTVPGHPRSPVEVTAG
jgi:integrase